MNVISSLNGVATNTAVSYEIRTTISLFEEYLKDCEVLDLCVTDEQLSTIIGLVTVRELHTLIQENPCHCYFPIVNTFGTRIGDLHVGFMVQFIHQSKNAHHFTCWITSDVSSMKEMSKHRDVASQVNALDGQRQRLRQCPERAKRLLKCETLASDTLSCACDVYKCRQSRGTQPISDSVISDILEQGQRLRVAMVRSVLEDDTDDFDMGDPYSNSLTDDVIGTWTVDRKMDFDDPEVMEFLSGKTICYKLRCTDILFCTEIKSHISNQRTAISTTTNYLFGCLNKLTSYVDTYWLKSGFPSCLVASFQSLACSLLTMTVTIQTFVPPPHLRRMCMSAFVCLSMTLTQYMASEIFAETVEGQD
jgi:hypothetical protein